MTNRYEEASEGARQLLENFDEIDLAEMVASSNASAETSKARIAKLEQEVTDMVAATVHLTTLMGKRAKEAEDERDRVQERACSTAEALRRAEQRADRAEAKAEAMTRAMESTAADALRHRGCHRTLMAQCLRAEQAEDAIERVREALESAKDRGATGMQFYTAGIAAFDQPPTGTGNRAELPKATEFR